MSLLVVSCLLLVNEALAQEGQSFVGPSGCTSKEECRNYCDIDNHKEECLNFAVKNGMMSQEDADRALKFLNQTGPGGCRGEECKTYCQDVSHREECIKFAEENGLIKPGKAERFRKFQEIEEKGGPGGCKGEECRTYCNEVSHREECFKFAREQGLIDDKEVERFEQGQKILEKIKETGGPGGCKDEGKCRTYCSDVSRVEECAEFGAKHTGKSPEEVREMLQKFKEHKDELMEMRREHMDERMNEIPGEMNFGQRPTEEEMEKMRAKYQKNRGRYQGMVPPEGMMRPPEGVVQPGDNIMQSPQDMPATFSPPPSETYTPPPTYSEPIHMPEPSPTSYDRSKSFVANIISAFMVPFRQ